MYCTNRVTAMLSTMPLYGSDTVSHLENGTILKPETMWYWNRMIWMKEDKKWAMNFSKSLSRLKYYCHHYHLRNRFVLYVNEWLLKFKVSWDHFHNNDIVIWSSHTHLLFFPSFYSNCFMETKVDWTKMLISDRARRLLSSALGDWIRALCTIKPLFESYVASPWYSMAANMSWRRTFKTKTKSIGSISIHIR